MRTPLLHAALQVASWQLMTILCIVFVCLVLSCITASSSSQTYQDDGEPFYDYSDGPFGPANWGTLHEGWRLCGEGQSQSPVAICKSEVLVNASSVLETFYQPTMVERSDDHALEIVMKSGGGVLYWNSEGLYHVLNMHWHTPSEHTINGVSYFNYMGSLTTPPCTEGLTWIVLQTAYTVSEEQVNATSIINGGNNARPLQPINGRIIYKVENSFIAVE
ncbi:hypothetical protein L7F22_065782 [Adiantum nelumboides]|nr:hypothetical protein [Adiantum nelumboides]